MNSTEKFVSDNPLMNLNLEKIRSIALLDEALDPLEFYNWDYSVEEGEIPLDGIELTKK